MYECVGKILIHEFANWKKKIQKKKKKIYDGQKQHRETDKEMMAKHQQRTKKKERLN